MDIWYTIQHSFIWSFVSTFGRKLANALIDGFEAVVESFGHLLDQFFSMF